MFRRPSGIAALLGLLAFLACAVGDVRAAEDTNPHLWKPRVTSVAVFKNGLGFFLGEGETALVDGWCASKEIPPAAFGTLAFFAYDEKQVVDIVGSGPGEDIRFDGVDLPDDPAVKRARLEANAGLKMQLTYKEKEVPRTAAGTLKSVGADYAILESDSNTLAVPVAKIERIQILELPVRIHVKGEGDKAPDRAKLGVGYLRKGIIWVPEYTLKIIDGETAELSLRGTLVNEAEDLVHCDVNFVVGVPHFVHTDFMAPIAVGQVIRTIGAAVVPREVMTQMANRAMLVSNEDGQARVIDKPVAAEAGDLGKALGNLPQLEGAGAGDYTVYTKKDLTVRRGEKAIVTLFTAGVKYSHVYRWAVPGSVEHFLSLANSTDTSWTTGPCLTLSQGQPLSEDILRYTTRGASGELTVTTAVNIAREATESETDRKLKAHSPAKDVYLDLVALKGELTIKNYEKHVASITVTAKTAGKPLQASDGGKLSVDTTSLRLTERSGSIEWRIKLQPNEAKTLTYTYERYVQSM